MPKTDIKIYSTEPSGKATTATISDVNPEATNDELKTLGQMLNSFTRNRYDKTNRINTIQCDTEPGGGSITPTFTLDKTSVSWADLRTTLTSGGVQNWFSIAVTYDGDGKFFVNTGSNVIGAITDDQNSAILLCSPFSSSAYPSTISEPVIVTIRADATDTYKAAETTFTITV